MQLRWLVETSLLSYAFVYGTITTRLTAIALVLAVEYFSGRKKASDYGFALPKNWKPVYAVLAAFFAIALIERIVFPWMADWYRINMLVNGLEYALLTAPLFVLLEELFMHSAIQSGAQKAFSKKAGVLLATAVFSLIHLGWLARGLEAGLVVVVAVTAMGYFKARLYARTNSVFATYAAHLAFNWLAFLQMATPWPLEAVLWAGYALFAVYALYRSQPYKTLFI
ncbi:hypothetical protein COU38_03910 [Candidatus Micrarchaeota archaeon CG10_big_fil_rev_8_21_14_0_10_54_18]|nr:MAG: hypothetical protein COU38_03910 [Candidatus Micrarchaeota archaeon CG10_big_fil_rev_8_21_14_0_10_54_18]